MNRVTCCKLQERLPGDFWRIRPSAVVSSKQINSAYERVDIYGCPAAVACGSWVTNWAQGKTFSQVQRIEANDLLNLLGGLLSGKEHCTPLAVNALKDALQG